MRRLLGLATAGLLLAGCGTSAVAGRGDYSPPKGPTRFPSQPATQVAAGTLAPDGAGGASRLAARADCADPVVAPQSILTEFRATSAVHCKLGAREVILVAYPDDGTSVLAGIAATRATVEQAMDTTAVYVAYGRNWVATGYDQPDQSSAAAVVSAIGGRVLAPGQQPG